MKTPSLTLTRQMSAFEFYKSKLKKAKRKKAPSVAVTRASGRKFLRSTAKSNQHTLLAVCDNVERLLSPETKVKNQLLRSGNYRKQAGKKKPKPKHKTNENKAVNSQTKTTKKKKPEKVAEKKNEESPVTKAPVPNKTGISQKGYMVRILQSSNSARSRPECADEVPEEQMSEADMSESEAVPEPPSVGYKVRSPMRVSRRIASSARSSVDEGRKVLAWLVEPESLDEFLSVHWLKEAKLVRRHQPSWYQHLQLSCGSLDTMLRSNHLQYGKNLDVTSYDDGKRDTHNPPGRALPSQVWDFYRNGCSVRWLNPQTYSSRLWLLNATLQEFFGCLVGANIYLTPPNSQGFAPHFDDIEAFVLQLEGKKNWRLYRPREEDKNPRQSSPNFKQEDIGEPFMDVTLHPGDLLYFPRGTVHQAVATDTHSLHVTLSCYQNNTWADLLEHVVPAALSNAIKEDASFREGLPLGHQDYVGSNCTETGGFKRAAFNDKVKQLVAKVLSNLPIDEGVDRMGKNFMAEALPPCLTAEERECSVYGSKVRVRAGGRVVGTSALNKLEATTKVKLIRRHCLRLVYEGNGAHVYYSTDNTCEFKEVEPEFLDIDPEMVPAVAMLIYAYPRYTTIEELPTANRETTFQLLFDMWEKGLLLTRYPLTDPEEEGGASFQRVD